MHSRLLKLTIVGVFVGAFLFTPLNIFSPSPALAGNIDADPTDNVGNSDLEDQLAEIERQLALIRKSQKGLKSQISAQEGKVGNYSGQIGVLGAEVESVQLEIAELELQIKELDLNIKILEDLIESKKLEIDESQQYVADLEVQTASRITDNYVSYRLNRRLSNTFFTVQDANSYFKDSQYKEIIQSQDNRTLSELIILKQQLEKDRIELEETAIQVLRDRELVDEQFSQLERVREDLQSQIDSYYGAIYVAKQSISSTENQLSLSNKQEARKMAQAQKIRQEIFNSFNSIPNGRYVLKGTRIGNQGSTGWSTGPHLHFAVALNGVTRNPCSYLPSGVVSDCGWGSQLSWPLRGSFYYTSRYYSGRNGDLRCFYYGGQYTCHSHPAIDIAHSVWNAPVYAAHDGWIQKGVDQYGALYIILCQNKSNCNSGFKTSYWHLSKY